MFSNHQLEMLENTDYYIGKNLHVCLKENGRVNSCFFVKVPESTKSGKMEA
jgi:hypothetical protein